MSSMVVGRGRQLEAKFIGSGRCLPVARGRAGSEGHVWPWNPTSPRRRAFHSDVPPPLSARRSLAPLTYLPRAYVSRFFFRAACLPPRPASRRLALTPRPPAGVFELAFFPRAAFAFREFRRVRRRRPTSTEFSSLRFERSRFPVRSLFVIIPLSLILWIGTL